MARAESPVNRVYSEHNPTHIQFTDLQFVNCNDNVTNNSIQILALAISLARCFLQVTLQQQHFLKTGRQYMAVQGQGLM